MGDDLWWRDGVIYQIYPRSFADSNGDGFGDLPGILSRLDYLSDLGVDAIWLSPFYPSPDKDFGYDISDHTAVDARYGSLADFDWLVAEAHRRNLRVILDLVLNHTSDRHPWFQESRANRHNPKADWYIWQDAIPNNWQSVFGGRAWTFDAKRGQYYLHLFAPEQPDVNWRNPDVVQAQLDVVRFWLERGVDGFRLDVFNAYFKDAHLRNNPPKPGIRAFDRQVHVYDINQPEMIPLLKEMRRMLNSFPERYAVGETFLGTPDDIRRYCGENGLHAAFDFHFLESPANPRRLLKPILAWEKLYREQGIWPNYVLSNHDVPRSATRYARGEEDNLLKVMMTLLLTLRGTPFLYYGEEIGMRNVPLKRHEIMDPPGKKYWPIYKGRDGCRSPMQWDASAYGGFSTARPWLRLHPDYVQRNVAAQQADPHSLYHWVRNLLHLRRQTPALRRGDFNLVIPTPQNVLAYTRSTATQTVLVVLNFSRRPQPFQLPPQWNFQHCRPLLSTRNSEGTSAAGLLPYEATIWLIPEETG